MASNYEHSSLNLSKYVLLILYIFICIFKVIYDALNDMTSLSNYINITSVMKSAQDICPINLNLYVYLWFTRTRWRTSTIAQGLYLWYLGCKDWS